MTVALPASIRPASTTPAHTPSASMARQRAGHTTAVVIGGEQFYLTANAATDGGLGEVFIHWGKHGSGPAGLMDLYASALTMALRHRVPLGDLIRRGLDLRFAPAGQTDDPDIPRVRSVADYVARRLALDWLPAAERARLGIYTRAEGAGYRLTQTFATQATKVTQATISTLLSRVHITDICQSPA